jgi:hypothetical protein
MGLTFQRVDHIRTSGERDVDLAARWRLSVGTIRDARVGTTWADHPTPPDTKPRAKRGNWGDLR